MRGLRIAIALAEADHAPMLISRGDMVEAVDVLLLDIGRSALPFACGVLQRGNYRVAGLLHFPEDSAAAIVREHHP